MRPYFFEQSGNASSPHKQGRHARKAIEQAREILAAFIGAAPVEIIFTSGASESNNHAVFSTAGALKDKGKHIIASAIEHHSVLEPLRQLQQDGFQVTFVEPKSDGIVALEDIKSALQSDTILVCLQHANNEIGTLQPVQEVGHLCRQRGIYFLVDATQTVGHIPVNVKDIQCDFCSLSAHKFYGPQGVGALYIRQGVQCPAFILGGDQERGRRAGTHNTTGIVGLGEAVKLCRVHMLEEAGREADLRDRIVDRVIKEIPSAVLNGHLKERLPNNAHFSFAGINGEELVSALDLAGVAVSMGSACTWGQLEPSHVLKAIGLTDRMALGSLRVTTGRWTTSQDIMYFLEQLKLKCKNALSNS
jgi:cysteine desulfurase